MVQYTVCMALLQNWIADLAALEERAGIIEFGAGKCREEAERLAGFPVAPREFRFDLDAHCDMVDCILIR